MATPFRLSFFGNTVFFAKGETLDHHDHLVLHEKKKGIGYHYHCPLPLIRNGQEWHKLSYCKTHFFLTDFIFCPSRQAVRCSAVSSDGSCCTSILFLFFFVVSFLKGAYKRSTDIITRETLQSLLCGGQAKGGWGWKTTLCAPAEYSEFVCVLLWLLA